VAFVIDEGGETFAPGDPPHGVCWAPTNNTLDVSPTWVRMDDPAGIRLATGWSITRGRQSETDKTVTGTCSIVFDDLNGELDPTNGSATWYGHMDPMKQMAVGLMNPVTGDWHTLFRGFNGGPDHELEQWEGASRGRDIVTWNCVDAFDVFANVVLTPGRHGHTPSGLAALPNILYNGNFLPNSPYYGTDADVEVHVDGRIVKLLDDAGWPGTGNTGRPGSTAPLRNIFSGNVTVQGSVYGRVDSLLQALFDAADAEFAGGIANIYVSKSGVVTFHGRYARFFPDRAGYGINHWYVGGHPEAALDPDVVPLAGPLRFYRSKDDVINSCMALPQNVDPTTGGVVIAEDGPITDPTSSQGIYGYRSTNFENLLTFAGHDDDDNPTTAIEECNKFADYYVGNYKDPKTRCQTLRFQARGPDGVGVAALWDLMTRVELGDVVTLTTGHVGGGGFSEDFFVEQIRYAAQPGRQDMLAITLELEVSPRTFYSHNPFGDWDDTTP